MSGLPAASKTLERLKNGHFRGVTNGSMSQSIRNENKSMLNKIANSLYSRFSRSRRSRRGGKKSRKGKTQKKRRVRSTKYVK